MPNHARSCQLMPTHANIARTSMEIMKDALSLAMPGGWNVVRRAATLARRISVATTWSMLRARKSMAISLRMRLSQKQISTARLPVEGWDHQIIWFIWFFSLFCREGLHWNGATMWWHWINCLWFQLLNESSVVIPIMNVFFYVVLDVRIGGRKADRQTNLWEKKASDI